LSHHGLVVITQRVDATTAATDVFERRAISASRPVVAHDATTIASAEPRLFR
jgi:hypothetical protein